MPTHWAILTGEFPPQPGGVADYTRQVANGLEQSGDNVTVFAPATGSGTKDDHRVIWLPGNFDRRARAIVQEKLQTLSQPRRILVQYVPHAFGQRAMNVGFIRWLGRLARAGEAVDVMFHEVAYTYVAGQPLKYRLLAHVTHWMAGRLANSADRVFISTLSWEPMLRQVGFHGSLQWLPVPSNISQDPDPAEVARLRARLDGANTTVVAHFGTYGKVLTELDRTFSLIMERDPARVLLLLGRGSEEFAAQFRSAHQSLAPRVYATGALDSGRLAAHIAAADLIVQPYPDGVSTRRSSAMAALALGAPIVTNRGHLTEEIWTVSGAVVLSPTPAASDVATAAESILPDRLKLREIGCRARVFYTEQFQLSLTIDRLRSIETVS